METTTESVNELANTVSSSAKLDGWDIATIAIYFVLVVAVGLFVSKSYSNSDVVNLGESVASIGAEKRGKQGSGYPLSFLLGGQGS